MPVDFRVGVGKIVAESRCRIVGEIDHFYGEIFLFCGNPELDFAAGTEGKDLFRTHIKRFLQPFPADVGGDGGVLDEGEHAAAAVCRVMVVFHFHEVGIRDCPDKVTRRFIDAGDPSYVA